MQCAIKQTSCDIQEKYEKPYSCFVRLSKLQKEVNKCLILMQFYFCRPKSQRLSENRQMCQKWGILRPKFHNLIEVARYKGIHCSCIAKKILKNIINIAKHYFSFEFRLSSSGENNRPGSLNKTALFIFLYNVYIIWFHQLFQTWASTLVTCMLTHMHQGIIKGGKFSDGKHISNNRLNVNFDCFDSFLSQ